ncbi:fructosamine kinase family protein [Sphingobium sp. BHU LFT2]|uniref:fructosamine kinase family protein n=1 Tax=Sphingobium sp. BHU LFT2 TaxID=2807634 RepID=UPI001BECEE44|nr:fructosamine kinase family protein [Sphingobium sp. BHU LFT2]MBT2245974.1 fructosamine kinase family protein [Sphingobium sp. BHU LFT2]
MRAIIAEAAALLGVNVQSAAHIAGGDLSFMVRLTLADGCSIIAKRGARVREEALMLEAIGTTGVPVPQIFCVAEDLLLLEERPNGGRLAGCWAQLAEMLDQLHAPAHTAYGWKRDYGFGALPIENGQAGNWIDFWAKRRLRCHIPHLTIHLANRIERLADRLAEHIPRSPPPALLHGDLWGGNILVDQDQISGLIDPACYYGDREVDLAMLSLFDRPPQIFYDACDLPRGWEERQPVYQLWPLLVHVRLFGGAYHQQAGACLDQLGV